MSKELQIFGKSLKNLPVMKLSDATEAFSAKMNLNSTPGSGALKPQTIPLRFLHLFFRTIVRVSGGRCLLNGRCDFAAMDDP